jgi:hypothetical protein
VVLVVRHVESAGVVAQVLVAVGAAPHVRPGLEAVVAPAAVGLEPVVSTAQWCDLAGASGSTGVVGDLVVPVAGMLVWSEASCGSGAPGEHTGHVAQDDRLRDAFGDLVGLYGHVLGKVHDRLHDHLHVGAATPVADGLGGDRGAGVLHSPDLTVHPGAADGGLEEVEVQDNLADGGLLVATAVSAGASWLGGVG